jgi:type 1 glutamine amidotransferase
MRYAIVFVSTVLFGFPHYQQLGEGVYAAGFAAKYGSANSGWVALDESTLLIDTPKGIDAAEYVTGVEKITGKPVRWVLLTEPEARSSPEMTALEARGIKRIDRTSGGIELIPYSGGRAVFIRNSKVLFTGPAGVNGPRMKLAGRDTAEWLAALETLRKLGAEKVVPGYGSWGDASLLERQRRFLRELRRQVGYMISMERPLEVIEKEVKLPAGDFVWMPYDDPVAEDIRHLYTELTVPAAPFRGKTLSGPKPHALVLIGDRYHEPGHVQDGLQPVFDATGVVPHYTVDVRALNAENLAKVKLLVILRDGMMWPDGPSGKYRIWMTPEQEKAVVDFVNRGGGFLNLHNSMGLYPENGPYLKLVGGKYIGHGPLERFRVEVVDHQHPITRGVRDFFAADEQHTPPYDDQKVHLLLRNRSDEGKTAAAGWAYEPGRGRLCHLASGHTREALGNPEFQRLLRQAVEWLLRR